MPVAAARGPGYPAGRKDGAARHVSRYQPPSGCGREVKQLGRARPGTLIHAPYYAGAAG